MKLTPWFSAHVTPARTGVYEREYSPHYPYPLDLWDGDQWVLLNAVGTPISPAQQQRRWRGLAQQPKEVE